VLFVYGYSQLDARLSSLQGDSESYGESIARIEETMDESQDRPISSDHTQNRSLVAHTQELKELRSRLLEIERRVYELGPARD